MKKNGRKIKIGILASGGGSALITAYNVFNHIYPDQIELSVATDRPCAIESYCAERGIACTRFSEKDREQLSRAISGHFDAGGGVDLLLLYFLRVITDDIFRKYITLNFHPALLPDFPGLDPVGQALDANAENLGATVHMVDGILDGGQIIAQAASVLPAGISRADAESLSFCQKVYITLWLFMMLKEDMISFRWDAKKGFLAELKDNPMIENRLIVGLDKMLEQGYSKAISELGYERFLKFITKHSA